MLYKLADVLVFAPFVCPLQWMGQGGGGLGRQWLTVFEDGPGWWELNQARAALGPSDFPVNDARGFM